METWEYVGGTGIDGADEAHDLRKFADGTWRQPTTFVRDMERFPTTADRLRAMRRKYPAPAGAPSGWTYDRGGCVGDPAYWYGNTDGLRGAKGSDGRRIATYHPCGTNCCGEGRPNGRPFRFVGFADEADRSIRHDGWYADEFGDSLARGVVFRLPARDGASQFVAGYEFGENSKRHGWRPDCCGIIDPATYDDEVEAARAADSLAEAAAESAREFSEAERERLDDEEREAEAAAEAAEVERLEFTDRTGGGD